MKKTTSSKHEPNTTKLLFASHHSDQSDDHETRSKEEGHHSGPAVIDTPEAHPELMTISPESIDIPERQGPTKEEEQFLREQIEGESLNLLRAQLIETLHLSDKVVEHHVIEREFRLSPTQSPQHEEVYDELEYDEMGFESSTNDREELQKYDEQEGGGSFDDAKLSNRNRLLIERFLDLDTPKLSIKMIDFISDDRVLKLFMGYLTQPTSITSDEESIREGLNHLASKRSLNVVNVLCNNTPSCRKLFQSKFELISKLLYD